MSLSLRATKVPEVVAHGFTRLDIKHRSSTLTHGNDTFEINFTDNRGQQFQMTLYAATADTDIMVDDATAYRINRPDVAVRDIHDAKKFLAACKTYRGDDESVTIDF
tara:strand:- start:442 stop:762 length:321 start_codon:yes stop_codon:yes gene_type:complete